MIIQNLKLLLCLLRILNLLTEKRYHWKIPEMLSGSQHALPDLSASVKPWLTPRLKPLWIRSGINSENKFAGTKLRSVNGLMWPRKLSKRISKLTLGESLISVWRKMQSCLKATLTESIREESCFKVTMSKTKTTTGLYSLSSVAPLPLCKLVRPLMLTVALTGIPANKRMVSLLIHKLSWEVTPHGLGYLRNAGPNLGRNSKIPFVPSSLPCMDTPTREGFGNVIVTKILRR